MNKFYIFCRLFIFGIVFNVILTGKVNAQCPVEAFSNALTITCGDPVNLSAVADGIKPLNNNFNGGTIGPDWQASNGAVVTNGTGTYSCAGPPNEGTNYLWMGAAVSGLRQVVTNDYDLVSLGSTSGTICFDMKYSTQAGPDPCEGIDLPAEGVSVQYSINNGASWVTIQYYDPNGGFDPTLTSWNRYCLNIPAAAFTADTRFRWVQTANSGAGFDTWGLDDMVITLNIPGFTFDWAHDVQGPTASSATPTVNPTATTTYTVTYTNGTQLCTGTVLVTVLLPTTSATISATSICAGGPVQLDAISALKANPPTSCGVNATAACTPFSTVADERTVGAGTVNSNYNDGTAPAFGNFGDAYRTTHIIYRAADLLAAGMVAGQINSLAFDVRRVFNGSTSIATKVYPEVKIDIGCTSAATMVSFSNPGVSFSNVYNPRAYTMRPGINTFFFDRSYNWDGVQNIVIRLCWRVAAGGSAGAMGHYAFTYDNAPGYNCTFTTGSNFEDGQCSIASPFTDLLNRRPNTTFGFCKPNTANLTYSWSSNPAGFTSSIRNPTDNPTVSTTYTVTVNQDGRPAGCAVTASVPITVNPEPPLSLGSGACSNGSTPIVANGASFCNNTTQVGYNVNTLITRCFDVSGVSPNAYPGALLSVFADITHADITEVCGNAGTNSTIEIQGPGMTGWTTLTALTNGDKTWLGALPAGLGTPAAGADVNGQWCIRFKDDVVGVAGDGGGLTFRGWCLNFNQGNNTNVTYSWSPTTSLTPTTGQAVTTTAAGPIVYTVTATNTVTGCTNTMSMNVTGCGIVLPVELVSFTAESPDNIKVNLNWLTASEQNSDRFEIERSPDAVEFEPIGSVNAAGYSTINKEYLFVDERPLKGANYYRLKQIDYDGNFKYYNVVAVEIKNTLVPGKLRPVPAVDILSYDIYSPSEQSVTLQVYDLLGKKIIDERKELKEEANTITTTVTQLIPGAYLLKITDSFGQTYIQKFIK